MLHVLDVQHDSSFNQSDHCCRSRRPCCSLMFQFEYFSVVLLDVFQVVKDWTWCLLTRSSLLTATLIRRTTYKPQHGLIELAKRGIARDRNFGIKGIDRRQIADVASVISNLERSVSPENLLDCLYTNILLVLLKLCRRKQYFPQMYYLF